MSKNNKLYVSKETANSAFQWCIRKWGKSKFQPTFPRLICHNKVNKEVLAGWFNEKSNTINICLPYTRSFSELIKTVIHEYTHYTQNVGKNYDKYTRIYSGRPYEDHPHEKIAYEREREYFEECKKYVLKEIKIKNLSKKHGKTKTKP